MSLKRSYIHVADISDEFYDRAERYKIGIFAEVFAIGVKLPHTAPYKEKEIERQQYINRKQR